MMLVARILLLFSVSTAEDIVIRRTEPDPNSQELPCPHQRVQYECTTLRPVASLTWILPSGDVLNDFTGGSSSGAVRNTLNGQFIATLTSKVEDQDPETDNFFFNATLLILNSTNGSTFECIANTRGRVIEETVTVTWSGVPNWPYNVTYYELSFKLVWSRPSYTGSRGVSVMNYTVSANGGTVVVSDDSEVVMYTSQSLIYGDVLVSAINSCGQQSLLKLANRRPHEGTVEVYCNEPIEDGRHVVISGEWMKTNVEEVQLNPGNIFCSLSDTSCTAVISTNDVYTLYVDGVKTNFTFNSMPLHAHIQFSSDENMLTVNVTIREICLKLNYTIVIKFGTEKKSEVGTCDFGGGVVKRKRDNVQTGHSHIFFVDSVDLPLPEGHRHCYMADQIKYTEEVSTKDTDHNSDGVIVGVTTTTVVVVLFLSSVLFILAHYKRKAKRKESMVRIARKKSVSRAVADKQVSSNPVLSKKQIDKAQYTDECSNEEDMDTKRELTEVEAEEGSGEPTPPPPPYSASPPQLTYDASLDTFQVSSLMTEEFQPDQLCVEFNKKPSEPSSAKETLNHPPTNSSAREHEGASWLPTQPSAIEAREMVCSKPQPSTRSPIIYVELDFCSSKGTTHPLPFLPSEPRVIYASLDKTDA